MNRQIVNGVLPDLPYAKQEAEYVSSVTNGKLYENEDAKKLYIKMNQVNMILFTLPCIQF